MTLFHHAVTIIWPGFHPGTSRLHAPDFTSSWESLWARGPALFHATIWHAAVNLSIRRRSPITEHASLMHYHRALRYLSEAVHASVDDVGESIMFAILALATAEEGPYQESQHAITGFVPPFPELQWLNILSRRPMVAVHREAMFRLVDLRGGLDALTMQGLAGAIFFLDVISATSNLSPPHFSIPTAFRFGDGFEYQRSPIESSEETSSAIHQLRSLGLVKEVHEVMLEMRSWTNYLEMCSDGSVPSPDLALISAQRSILQHRLLCTLSPSKGHEAVSSDSREASEDGDTPEVTDLVQSGTLIFSTGVVFPIADTQVHHRLAKRLKRQLLRFQDGMLKPDLHDLSIWLCMLGCLAAIQASDQTLRDWFLEAVLQVEKRRATRRREAYRTGMVADNKRFAAKVPFMVRSWSVTRDSCLRNFLWHSHACDLVAEVVWKEVQWKAKHCI
ncbi:hypothetical protein H2200_011989 [Cladophialophora chaetospira]|uniref:Uncharacterized protein n=1 Tax=Cladophialophora chaetospira TaxID=386627 RepID=A0AA39CD10_9EURO|nr:hypothetical protein H2200_011989 [Cladophialophora chaetospira]